jgi:flagellar motility protein MotE (MotC chaperone)
MYQPQGDNRHQLLALQEKIRQRREQLEQQLRDIHALQQELDDAEQRCVESLKDLETK